MQSVRLELHIQRDDDLLVHKGVLRPEAVFDGVQFQPVLAYRRRIAGGGADITQRILIFDAQRRCQQRAPVALGDLIRFPLPGGRVGAPADARSAVFRRKFTGGSVHCQLPGADRRHRLFPAGKQLT